MVNDYICLYVVMVWIVVVVICELWMKNEKTWVFGEKWIWWWFWYEMRLWFHVCKCFDCLLMYNNKVWGTNLGQRGSKLDGFQRGNIKSGCTCLVQLARRVVACHDELPRTEPMTLGIPGSWGSFRTFPNASFDVFDYCFDF